MSSKGGAGAYGGFTMQEVMAHNSPSNAWTVVDGRVYDITDFLNRHPGGYYAISRAIGKDGTTVFSKLLNDK